MNEGDILEEIIQATQKDGASYTDGEVLDNIVEILKKEGKL